MAVAKINKIEIIGLNKDRDGLLGLLQKRGSVQLINIQKLDADISSAAIPENNNLLEIEEAISFLASFKEQTGFLEGMVNLKPEVYQQELKEVIHNFYWQGLLKDLADLRNQLKVIHQHKERLYQERQVLACWHDLTIPLDELYATENCGIILGVLRTTDYPQLLKDCKTGNINLFCEVVNQNKTNTYLLMVYIQKDFEHLEGILKSHYFNFVTLGRHRGTAKDRLLEINREILVLDDQIQDTKEKIIELSKERFKLMVVYDYLCNIKKVREAENNLAKQQFTFVLSGWIKAKDVKLVEKAITDKFQDVAVFISEAKCEEAPVDLENNPVIRPFEFITKIYGLPKYNELDPTPFLAPFFFLYFGFCVSDAGYGAMLVLISGLALKKFKLGPQGKRFFQLFLFCGISAIIIGALTGSWFGNLFDLLGEANKIFLPLKRFKDSLVMLDPLKEPTKLLGIALSFGIIQVWFGNIVAAIGNVKNKRYLDVVLDQVPMLIFLFGFTGSGFIFLKLLDNTYINIFKYAVLIGATILILTQGRAEKGLGAKLFYGIYYLYNAFSGYLSDILSYSRLWALGLVTGVMATTINLIAVQFSQILPSLIPAIDKISFLKIALSTLILMVIFVFGHVVSFLMNLLGAFVHPVRLQFVEFFSKFFKSGGRAFRPFKVETKYINISEAIPTPACR
jgi:V/A-type H+-transporting ATPase subunit I